MTFTQFGIVSSLGNMVLPPKYVSGGVNNSIKSDGNRSRLSSSSMGFINILAKGVAVYPTYEAIENLLNICLMHLLIDVGDTPSFAVLMDALSASSSMINMLFESSPLFDSSDCNLKLTLSRMLFTFLRQAQRVC